MKTIAILSLLLAITPLKNQPKASDIDFHATVRADKGGKLLCALYKEDGWLSHDKVFRTAEVKIKKTEEKKNAHVTCHFKNVPFGTYGIAALHDENDNKDMDYTAGIIPAEGYCASRDAEDAGMFAPDWEDARFKVSTTVLNTQKCGVHYW